MNEDRRPAIRVLVVRGNWTASTPEGQMDGAVWARVDLRNVEACLMHGFRIVAIDPETEAAWREWRLRNPEAV